MSNFVQSNPIFKKLDNIHLDKIGQNCLKQIMSQFLDYTKKSRKKSKIIRGSELSEKNNEPTFRSHQKIKIN